MATISPPPRLEDRLRDAIRLRDYSLATERQYAYWYRTYVRFHDRVHPRELGPDGVRRFLDYLALERNVAPATQHQALCALLFLYRHVLGVELGDISDFARSRRKPRLPVVLSRDEVRRLLARLDGIDGLVARLLYGAGLRLHEALRLRIKDVDFGRRELLVRSGKGDKDRVTVLPDGLEPALRRVAAISRRHFTPPFHAAGSSGISQPAWRMSSFLMRWRASTREPAANSAGVSCSRRRRCRGARGLAPIVAIICIRRASNGL